jgi:hypothetical protein
VSGGPATPLTPKPMGNTFAGSGFWEQLTPKTPAPQTPVTAIPRSPYSPIVPHDQDACTPTKDMDMTFCGSRRAQHERPGVDQRGAV